MIKEKFSIKDKVAVITGGAGMLGREFAKSLVEFGGKVVLLDIDEEKGRHAVKEIKEATGGDVFFNPTDITSKESVREMVSAVIQRYERVDILINNAALDPKFENGVEGRHEQGFEEYPLDMWERALSVNLTGAFLCCQAIGRHMVNAGGGVIVNIASELALIAPDHRIYLKKNEPEFKSFKPVDYPVTKAALLHLTRYLASYWGDKNIRVNSLCPAAVYTSQDDELVENISYRTILGRMSKCEEFCGPLIYLVSDASSYMTGANLVVDGGRSAW